MEIYTVPDVAQKLSIPYITVYKAMQRLGAGRKIGGTWILDEHDFQSIREDCQLAINRNSA